MKELFEVTPEQAKEWREREQARMRDGTYTPLPEQWLYSAWFCDWDQEQITWPSGERFYPPRFPDHFAHISIDKVAMIAFTESEQKGHRDRQTRINPGKYLARFYSEWLSREDIQQLATQMGADYNDDAELCFAKTADEIEHVYCNGPTSCMDGRHSFDSDEHPTRVYAGFDLELAYLKRNGGITARALCWPEKKIYSRVYGDKIRLETMLGSAGYHHGSLDGARITRLMQGDAYVIPYLDNLAGAVDHGKYLKLSEDGGDLCCCGDCQNGLSEAPMQCDGCGERIDEDDVYSEENGHGSYCRHCWEENHWQCENTGRWYHNDYDAQHEVRVRPYASGNGYRTETWGERAVDRHAFFCDRDEVYYSNNYHTSTDVQGETWGPEAVQRDAVLINGEWYDRDDAPTESEEPYGPHYCPTMVQEGQLEMDGVRHQPTAEIVVGCMVRCVDDDNGHYQQIKVNKIYKVSELRDGYLYVSDDNGRVCGGWLPSRFVFHSAPQVQTGLHIRHEPSDEYSCHYHVYDGDAYISRWLEEGNAQTVLRRLQNESRAAASATADAMQNIPQYAAPLPEWRVMRAVSSYNPVTNTLTTRNT